MKYNKYILSILILQFIIVIASNGFCTGNNYKLKKKDVINTFRDYKIMTKKLILLADSLKNNETLKKRYLVAYSEHSKFYEQKYYPALRICKTLVLDHNDKELVYEFFLVMIEDTSTSAEEPTWMLGELFTKKPGLISNEFDRLNNAQKIVIYRDILLGFAFVTYKKEKKIHNYSYLKKLVDKMKPHNYLGDTYDEIIK